VSTGLGPSGPPAGWRLSVYPELPSTADLLAERAAAGEPEGLAVLALRQTAGRGRAGRSWASPVGNLYLSLLLRPATSARDAAQWSLLAGVALIEAASAILPDPSALSLKWPNDLLLGGAKCAGILVETSLASDGSLAWLSLGIGVNLAVAPALPDRPTAHFNAAEAPEPFACRLLERLDHWRALAHQQGFTPVRAAWERRGPPAGAMITVRQPSGSLTGRFAGLAEDGALLLQVQETTRRITTGEVDGTG
jgi:BirA family transcriptional regulator, biotin operon repressor / biotin---[acetyl-CoA-carboxylase] ligase